MKSHVVEHYAAHAATLSSLIVDDNHAAALTLAWMIQGFGDIAHTAFDGYSGLKMADELRPDIIFLDLGMRGLNGLEVCRTLRADVRFERTRIIAQTGWDDAGIRLRTLDAGFTMHLKKPLSAVDVENAIWAARLDAMARVATPLSVPGSSRSAGAHDQN